MTHAAGLSARRDLLTMTYAYSDRTRPTDTRFAGNNLACSNCHLEAAQEIRFADLRARL